MVLDLILIGLTAAAGPLPLTPFMVVLPFNRGVKKGAASVFGWLVSWRSWLRSQCWLPAITRPSRIWHPRLRRWR